MKKVAVSKQAGGESKPEVLPFLPQLLDLSNLQNTIKVEAVS